MTAVPMTREEYQKKYGVAPVFSGTSTLDVTPAPLRMTRAEYEKEFGVTPEGKTINNPLQNLADRKAFFPANTETSNPLGNIAKTFGNIPSSAANLARLTFVDPVVNAAKSDKLFQEIYANRGVVEGTKDILGGFADTYLKTGEAIYGSLDKAYNALLDNPAEALKSTTSSFAKIGVEDPLFVPSLLYGGGALGKRDSIAKFADVVTRGADTSIPAVVEKGRQILKETAENSAQKAVERTADEILAVEQNYVGGRKANQFSNDGGVESRTRIAKSGVLKDSISEDGLISTKQPGGAVERYTAETIDGFEDVVKKGLEREGASINLAELEKRMIREINKAGFEGADLIKALGGIKKEIAGLARRADESGNVPLDRIQTAKISTTKNINYQTPPEVATYRKSIARTYKTAIEDKSKLNVREVNAELAKYYEDIKRLEALDGKKVKGGKLGKYTAQVSGNVVGGLAGGAVGGVTGAAIGGVIGGELSTLIKGKSMASGFGKVKNGKFEGSDVLSTAKKEASLPKQVDLKTPDPVVGLRADIPKTKEVIEVEAQIKQNVKAQKKAIQAKDFTLVQTLKEIYVVLVERLKELAKELSKPQRGFIRIGGEDVSEGKPPRKSQQVSPSKNSTTDSNAFQGFDDLSTKLLEKLKGRSIVSKQFISDLTNSPDLKQAEKDLIRRLLDEGSVDDVGDYAMSHRPSEGPPAHNLIEKVDGEQMIPSDMYDRWYGSRGTEADKESIAALKRIKDNPDAEVTIYRASPTGTFNRGDWVSFSKKYAQEHAQGNGTKVVEKKVKASDVRWAMDDVNEFGYYPPKSDQINVPDFANRVKSELLPLPPEQVKINPRRSVGSTEDMVLPNELRGPVANYQERVYQTPVNTSAGHHHFTTEEVPNYFAHSRIEDLPDGQTRRVIEAQSDLFQKGRLEKETEKLGKELRYASPNSQGIDNIEQEYRALQYKKASPEPQDMTPVQIDARMRELEQEMRKATAEIKPKIDARKAELAKLEPYRNTWHERVIREEVKQAAKDGKTKLQFPTGETAMKIEGLGENTSWTRASTYARNNRIRLGNSDMKVGLEINDGNSDWIITDVLGDGKFEAVPKVVFDDSGVKHTLNGIEDFNKGSFDGAKETFDISGKVDTENPIYKFYEKTVQKYLANKYGGKVITDPQGVKWVEIDIKPEYKGLPVEAFGVGGAMTLGLTSENE